MKLATVHECMAGSSVEVIKMKRDNDYGAVLVVAEVPREELALACMNASMEALADRRAPHEVQVRGNRLQMDPYDIYRLALAGVDETHSYAGLRFLIARTKEAPRSSSLMVAERSGDAGIPDSEVAEIPIPFVPAGRFAQACSEAIDAGRIAPTSPLRRSAGSHLDDFYLIPRVAGVEAYIRLDYACAIAKRAKGMPCDAYGDRIYGVMLQDRSSGKALRYKKWVVAYDYDAKRNMVRQENVASIDHVLPQSRGGRTRLCNLQLMRIKSNSRKGSDDVPDVSGEPGVSLKVMARLLRGVARGRSGGELDEGAYADIVPVIHAEMQACAEDFAAKARESAKSAAGSVSAVAGGVAGAMARILAHIPSDPDAKAS
jgi:hypothetical protein